MGSSPRTTTRLVLRLVLWTAALGLLFLCMACPFNPFWKLFREEGSGPVLCAAFSPDGRRILWPDYSGNLHLCDTDTGEELRRFHGRSRAMIAGLAFNCDGRLAVSTNEDNVNCTLRLWDLESAKEVGRFAGHTDFITAVSFTPADRLLVSASRDDSVRIWDVASRKELHRLDGHTADVNCLAVSRDGRYALSGGGDYSGGRLNDPSIRLWDLQAGTMVREFPNVLEPVYGVAFSPNGKTAVSSASDGLTEWNVETGKQLYHMPLPTRSGRCVAWSHDGRYLLSGSEDGTLQLWDAERGTRLHPFTGHSRAVRSVVFSPDGKRALSTAGEWGGGGYWFGNYQLGHEFPLDRPVQRSRRPFFDCTVRIWHVATGTELVRFGDQASDKAMRFARLDP